MSFARRLRNALLVLVAVTIVGGALILVPLWAGPSLPSGASRLQIETGDPGPVFGCQAALLSPVRVATSGDELILISVETGDPILVRWPGGHAAWRLDMGARSSRIRTDGSSPGRAKSATTSAADSGRMIVSTSVDSG